jgi:hypothetical protein
VSLIDVTNGAVLCSFIHFLTVSCNINTDILHFRMA